MLADSLLSLRADASLVLAAERGLIVELACAMPKCRCPQGRTYFEKRGNPKHGLWAPSADRFPIPGRDGGAYTPTNVRLAHLSCNNADGGSVGATIGHASRTVEERKQRAAAAGRLSGPGVSRWHATPEGHLVAQKAGFARASWGRTTEGRVSARRAGQRGGAVISCRRWRVERGKSCTCGVHV